MTEPFHLKLSVTELVEFSARSGDLYYEGPTGPTALEGVLGHQRVQKARGPEWQREVLLKHCFAMDDYQVSLQGRVDLLHASGEPCIIEEIKTTLAPAACIPPGKLALYWAQARVYGCLHGLCSGHLPAVDIRLSLFNLATRELHSETRPAAFADLLRETEALLVLYVDWHRRIQSRQAAMRASARALPFPYSGYRAGQHAFAANVYRAIRDRATLLVEAPTGTGKTISTLYPACKAAGAELADQILYLTAKTSGQAQAEAALALLRNKGLLIDSLTLCAKEKMCPCRGAATAGPAALLDEAGICRYTRGFYDRLPAARQACLAEPSLDQPTLQRIGTVHQVCPFALGYHMAAWTTAVIGDYNYFFDPLTRLQVFADYRQRRVLLMDELHNLPERARAMFSASLSSAQLAQLAACGGLIAKKCRQLRRIFARLRAQQARYRELPAALTHAIGELVELFNAQLTATLPSGNTTVEPQQNLLPEQGNNDDERRELYRFYVIGQLFGTGHRLLVTTDVSAAANIRVQIRCLDPAAMLQECLAGSHSRIGFSATLTPADFYIRTLGLPAPCAIQRLDYPFPQENLLVMRCDFIDTRWEQRETSLPSLVGLLAGVIRTRPGKYLVFFPSYDYLQKAFKAFTQRFPATAAIVQEPAADRAAQETFLGAFLHSSREVLGFAILGGIFAEGVDYRADALHGAIIVGTGMPQPSEEQRLIAEHFAEGGYNGFQYAYQFPGFTRVQQTAGRVIRSETDKGVVILVDPRFARPDFKKLMPPHWRPQGCGSLAAMERRMLEFWREGIEIGDNLEFPQKSDWQ